MFGNELFENPKRGIKKVSSSAYEIYEKLLEMGFSEEELQKEIKRKGEEFGNFISQKGILFIIAKENGIIIESAELEEKDYEKYLEYCDEIDYEEFTINISDLEEGMHNIVLLGKILRIFTPREFVRKDSSIGRVGSFYISDITGKIKVVAWDDKTKLMENEYFTIDQIIRIVGGYAKSNRDGGLEVHLVKKSDIILAPQDIPKKKLEDLIAISNEERELEKQRKNDMQLYDLLSRYSFIKKIQGYIKIDDFREITKKNGNKTFLLKCIFSDNSMSIGLVVWGMNAVRMLKLIQDGDYVLLQNLTIKENNYTNEKELLFTQKSSLEIL